MRLYLAGYHERTETDTSLTDSPLLSFPTHLSNHTLVNDLQRSLRNDIDENFQVQGLLYCRSSLVSRHKWRDSRRSETGSSLAKRMAGWPQLKRFMLLMEMDTSGLCPSGAIPPPKRFRHQGRALSHLTSARPFNLIEFC